ncbi:MAG: Hpt domain-containing protein, partial [bacterium]
LDIEISRLEQESTAGIATDPPDGLLRQMLFYLGPLRNTDSDRIRQIQDTLGLPQWFGTDSDEYEQLAEITRKLGQIRERFDARKFDLVESLVSDYFSATASPLVETDQNPLTSVLQELLECSEQAELAPLCKLVKQLSSTVSEIEKSADALTATAADIKIASALLFIRNSVAHAESIDATWEHSISSYIEELQALSTQSEKSKDRAIRIKKVAEVEYHHARSAASGQIKDALSQVEEVLSRFESDQDDIDSEQMGYAIGQLGQIKSIFSIAENITAAKLCDKTAKSLSKISHNELELSRSLIEHIAYAVAAIGAAADHLAKRGPDAENALKKALKWLRKHKPSRPDDQNDGSDDRQEESRQAFRVLMDKLVEHRKILDPNRPDSIERLSDVFVVLEAEHDLDPARNISILAGFGHSLCTSLSNKEFDFNADHAEFIADLEHQLGKLGNSETDVDLEQWASRFKSLIAASALEEGPGESSVQSAQTDEQASDSIIDDSLQIDFAADADAASGGTELLDVSDSGPVIDLQAELAALSASLKEDGPEDDYSSMMDEEIELDADAVSFSPEDEIEISQPFFEDDEDSELLNLENSTPEFQVPEESEENFEAQTSALDEVEDQMDLQSSQEIERDSTAAKELKADGAMLVQLDKDLKSIFVSEFTAHLKRLDKDIERLGIRQQNTKVLNGIISDIDECIHTLSGNCRNLGFDEAAECAESGMERLRQEFGSEHETESISHFREGILLLRQALDQIRADGKYDKNLAGRLLAFHFSSRQTLDREGEDKVGEGDFPVLDPNLIEQAQQEEVSESGFELTKVKESQIQESAPTEDSELSTPSVSTDLPGKSAEVEDEDIDEEIRQIFLEETEGILGRINAHLIEWRDKGLMPNVLAGIRREFHTLKGSAAATGFDDISGLSHSVETLLERSRPDPENNDGAILNLLEEMHDGLAADLGIMSSGSKGHLPTLHRMVSELISPASSSNVTESGSEETIDTLAQPPELSDSGPGEMQAFDRAESPEISTDMSKSNREVFEVEAGDKGNVEPLPPIESLESWMPNQVEMAQTSAGIEEAASGGSLKIDNSKLAELINASGELSLVRTQLQNTLDATRMDLDVLRASMSSMRAGLRDLEIEADAQIRARPEQQQAVNADEEFDPLQLDRYSRLQAKSRDVTEMLDQLAKVERDLGNRAS